MKLTRTQKVRLGLFLVLITAISCWFCSAVIGMILLLTRGDKDELGFGAVAPRPSVRTALLMPLYNEDARASFGRLAQIEQSLARLGASQAFDIVTRGMARWHKTWSGQARPLTFDLA